MTNRNTFLLLLTLHILSTFTFSMIMIFVLSHYISDISFSLQLEISFNRTKTQSVQIANIIKCISQHSDCSL